jgi:hypothetical protein
MESSTVWIFAVLINIGSFLVAFFFRSLGVALATLAILGRGYLLLNARLKQSDEFHWLIGLSVMYVLIASVYALPGAALGANLARRFRSHDSDR